MMFLRWLASKIIGLLLASYSSTVAGKGVTGDIGLDTLSAMALLKKQVDKAMVKFKRKNPEFFNAYTSARIIVDLGGGRAEEASVVPVPPVAP